MSIPQQKFCGRSYYCDVIGTRLIGILNLDFAGRGVLAIVIAGY
jgi:hypothetical protein